MFKIYDQMNTVVQENVRGIRVVKAYVREEYETEKFQNVSGRLYKAFSRRRRLWRAFRRSCSSACMPCMLLISWFGARLIVGGTHDDRRADQPVFYAMQILMSLMMVAMVFVTITMSKASAERIVEVLEEKPDLHNPAQPGDLR